MLPALSKPRVSLSSRGDGPAATASVAVAERIRKAAAARIQRLEDLGTPILHDMGTRIALISSPFQVALQRALAQQRRERPTAASCRSIWRANLGLPARSREDGQAI
jgi:hypothetical protein